MAPALSTGEIQSFRDRVFVVRDDVGTARLDSVTFLLSASERRLHELNGTAAAIWGSLEAGRSVGAVIALLSAQFGVSESTIELDVLETILRLNEGGLLVERSVDQIDASSDRLVAPAPTAPVDGRPLPTLASGSWRIGPFAALDATVVVDAAVGKSTPALELRAALDAALKPLTALVDLTDSTRARSTLCHIELSCEGADFVVRTDGRTVMTTSSVTRTVRAVLAELNMAAIGATRSAVVFHAAAVEFPAGAVVFAGQSNAGKSTMATHLLQRGHGYLTDEAVAVDLTANRVRPFPKSLCLESGAQQLFPHLAPSDQPTATWDVDPRSIGAGVISPGADLRAVVFVSYTPDGPAAPALETVASHDVIVSLLENAFDFSQIGGAAFERIAAIANTIPCYRLSHSGGAAPLDLLESAFGSVAPVASVA